MAAGKSPGGDDAGEFLEDAGGGQATSRRKSLDGALAQLASLTIPCPDTGRSSLQTTRSHVRAGLARADRSKVSADVTQGELHLSRS
jgi:hypothetical protein